jgi:hypothetical protein
MKPMSTKRAAIERQKTIVYAEILDERGEFCECCGAPANDMSHNYPRAPFVWLIAEKNNITVLCRGCHNAFGDNRSWELPEGWKILRTMMALLLSEEDDHRRQLMRSHYIGKMYSMQRQAKEGEILLPEWCRSLLNEVKIEL